MMKKLTAIRGATISENTPQDITKNVCDMCNEIIIKNKLKASDLVSIFFTVTKDITALNPATALRKGKTVFDTSEVALFCAQECEIEGGSPFMIRVMITAYKSRFVKKENVYINGAQKLRPDFVKES
ncbi:MAG: chorismate mutase [Treponema sp.]|nr:chorismate mutase [Treponema sp.]MDY3130985.1 chorismate mutase [Treponema sp.]